MTAPHMGSSPPAPLPPPAPHLRPLRAPLTTATPQVGCCCRGLLPPQPLGGLLAPQTPLAVPPGAGGSRPEPLFPHRGVFQEPSPRPRALAKVAAAHQQGEARRGQARPQIRTAFVRRPRPGVPGRALPAQTPPRAARGHAPPLPIPCPEPRPASRSCGLGARRDCGSSGPAQPRCGAKPGPARCPRLLALGSALPGSGCSLIPGPEPEHPHSSRASAD